MSGTEQCVGDIARIFDNSVSAAAIVSRDGMILYKNAACEKLLNGEDYELFSVYNGTSYEKTVLWGMNRLRLCVTPLDGECCLVTIIPERDNYFSMLKTAVREAAADMSLCLDDLSERCSDSGSRDLLDSLDRIMFTLLTEALIPEELELLDDMTPLDDRVVCVSEIVRRFIDELGQASVHTPLFISDSSCKIAPGLYARIPESALRLLLLDFMSVCMDGEYCIEGVGMQLTRDAFSNRAVLELTCGFIGHKENVLRSKELVKHDGASSPVSELEAVLESRFGCEISKSGNSDFSVLGVTMPLADPKGINSVRSSQMLYGSLCIGSDVRAYLTKHRINRRYLNKKG